MKELEIKYLEIKTKYRKDLYEVEKEMMEMLNKLYNKAEPEKRDSIKQGTMSFIASADVKVAYRDSGGEMRVCGLQKHVERLGGKY